MTSDGAKELASDLERNDDSAAFGFRVRQLREGKRQTLADIAQASKVSRAMLSKIERGEANPTIVVAQRIAKALETSLSFLTGAVEHKRAIMVTRKDERSVFQDPVSGFERHLLSPPSAGTGIELILHVLPPATSTGPLPAPATGSEKHIVVLSGAISVDIDGQIVTLSDGDTLFFEADVPHAFTNSGADRAQYLVFISRRSGSGP